MKETRYRKFCVATVGNNRIKKDKEEWSDE